jgi:hypothetical protein
MAAITTRVESGSRPPITGLASRVGHAARAILPTLAAIMRRVGAAGDLRPASGESLSRHLGGRI